MKSYKVLFSHQAFADLKEAKKWYNLQQRGLGQKLTLDVKATILSIKQNPTLYSVKFNNIRTFACKTFPYTIHYELDEKDKLIRIVSVFHFSRQPYWVNE